MPVATPEWNTWSVAVASASSDIAQARYQTDQLKASATGGDYPTIGTLAATASGQAATTAQSIAASYPSEKAHADDAVRFASSAANQVNFLFDMQIPYDQALTHLDQAVAQSEEAIKAAVAALAYATTQQGKPPVVTPPVVATALKTDWTPWILGALGILGGIGAVMVATSKPAHGARANPILTEEQINTLLFARSEGDVGPGADLRFHSHSRIRKATAPTIAHLVREGLLQYKIKRYPFEAPRSPRWATLTSVGRCVADDYYAKRHQS